MRFNFSTVQMENIILLWYNAINEETKGASKLHYVMSDIHGEYEKYKNMLKEIKFSDDDMLYVIGDVIDRSAGGLDILKDLMERKNAILIRGNHEQMCLDTLGPVSVYNARQLWQSNGGSCTRREMLYCMTAPERRKVLKFIEKTPFFMDVEVNGTPYHLVHGYPSADNDNETRIWGRVEKGKKVDWPCMVIVGHTPTVYLAGDDAEQYTIFHGDGFIDIDCGCGNETKKRRLACLRLDDMKEFYV